MKANFTETKKGTWAYIQKSVRINGKSTTVQVKKLGLLSDIRKEYGCADPRQWVIDLAKRMTEEERAGQRAVELPFYPHKRVEPGEMPLRTGGDMLLLPLYTGLGLPDICGQIKRKTRIKYDLEEILRTLVMGRILFPGSKIRTLQQSRDMVVPTRFSEEEMYRALTLLSGHMDDIQSIIYSKSKNLTERRDRIIYYDCTNFYFEIEDNDLDIMDQETGEVVEGLRKRGKSKENRPNPIVQMGMFMDMDGIPLAFVIFPGNCSEQTSLQPLEEKLHRRFGMTDFIVSTDAGLGSESNRRYNMGEGRDYICVQSLPSLKEEDRNAAVDGKGWRLACCGDEERASILTDRFSKDGIFDIGDMLKDPERSKVLLADTTFYKEILIEKEFRETNPEYVRAKKETPDRIPVDAGGKRIPRFLKSFRQERVIVTYSHDFALFLKHKREERLSAAKKIVAKGQENARRSQQSPLNYIEAVHKTESGDVAVKTELVIREDVLEQEEALDGFYAYGTSLEDDALLVLKARSFHHEIEHLFRTTKTHLDARPVHLSRQDRIKTHFLTCFIAMVMLKILQKKLSEAYAEMYREHPLTIDSIIETLRGFRFGTLPAMNYQPMFRRTDLTDQLQEMAGIQADTEIITHQKMMAMYRKVKKS